MIYLAITTYKAKPVRVHKLQAKTLSDATSDLAEKLYIANLRDARLKASTYFSKGKITFNEFVNYPVEPLREIYYMSEVPDDFDFFAYAEGLKRKLLELPESNMR